jgi:hypothetical protein
MNIILFLRYLIIGFLSAYLLIYGLRPSVPYPETVIEFYENFWLLLLLIIINFYLYLWDRKIGLLLCLSIVALIFDMIMI